MLGYWHADYPTAYFETFGNRFSPKLGKMLEKFGWSLARKTYGNYAATFAASECVARNLGQQGIDRVLLCPLGVDVDLFHPKHADPALRRKYQAEDRPLVFFPHRLFREKGIKEVAEAVPQIAQATGAVFLFSGDGPESPLVERLVASRDDCHYLGFIKSPEEMARLYASSDLVFGLSAWETFGLSIIEAMASGVPLIGADRGAAHEWITRANCGVTIPHGNTPALVEASIEMLRRSDRPLLGRRGRQFVTRYFSWEATFERMLCCYRRLVDAHRRGMSWTDVSNRLSPLLEIPRSGGAELVLPVFGS